jgi:hypothetical protein
MAELGVYQSAVLTDLALCVNRYRLFSPGWYECVLATVQLSPEESDVPGLVAMVDYDARLHRKGRVASCRFRRTRSGADADCGLPPYEALHPTRAAILVPRDSTLSSGAGRRAW